MQELENYKKEKLTIDLVWANIFGVLLLIPIVLIFGIPYYFLCLVPQDIAYGELYILGILILGIIVHELIHGITWAQFAKSGFKSIRFGILWKMLTPYCHCKEPLKVRQYIIGAITPAIILGLIPSLLAIIIGHLGLLIFGMLFTMAAGGDFLIINLIRKENIDDLVQDHPSEAGCYIYRKVD
jgi:hypothetical protein